jgi:hypothetical protein
MAVTATFSAGVVTVFGDNLGTDIVVSRDAAGALLVKGGAVGVAGGVPSVANTTLIHDFARGETTSSRSTRPTAPCRARTLFGRVGRETS